MHPRASVASACLLIAFHAPATAETIVDNLAAVQNPAGSWTTSTTLPGFYGSNYYHDGNTGKGKTITFTPNLTAGEYAIYARWNADSARSNSVPFAINHKNGTANLTVNQQVASGEWARLGGTATYEFNAGTGGNVIIGTAGTSGYVIADAIRWVPEGDVPASVTMSGGKTVAAQRHDGSLRPVVGVQEHALFRPTNNVTPAAGALEGHAVVAARYNHHPFLTFWNSRFWAYYMGLQVDDASKVGYLQWSDDGRNWNASAQAAIFPAPLATHQRMAFYTASNGRLLVTTWYSQNGESGRGGVGSRLVREIYGPNTFSSIQILKQNADGGASGIAYPLYTASSDNGFKAACAELLVNKVYMQQMWEEDEDRTASSPYEVWGLGNNTAFEAKAFAWYRLDGPNGRIIGNWKGGWVGQSSAGNWLGSQVTRDVELNRFNEHRNAKMWGEPRSIGGYALFYSMGVAISPSPPIADSRTPLVVATGNDGLNFTDGAFCISGDSGPQLFRNATADNKTVGGSYVRGISWVANREDKPRYNDNIWITYSTNKEVVWVTEVPKEVTSTVAQHVNDQFATWTPGSRVGQWNIRNGGWTPVRLVADGANTVLRFRDQDPYDYAKAFRVFPASPQATVTTTVRPKQANGELHVDLVDATGKRPARLRFSTDGTLRRQDAAGTWHSLGNYTANTAVQLQIALNATAGQWTVHKDGTLLAQNLPVAESVTSVERVEYRTGAWRLDDFSTNAYGGGTPGYRTTDLSGAHDPVALKEFDVLGLTTLGGGGTTLNFSPGAGNYAAPQSVAISSSAGGYTIRYTTNGTDPSPTTGTIYSGPISISASTTLKAIAYQSGFPNSAIATAAYVIGGGSMTTVLDDPFTDGGRSNGADALDSAWYLLANGTPTTAGVTAGQLVIGTTSTAVQGTNPHAVTTFPATTLANGERITLSFNFKSSGAASATGIRFGLFNSGGTNLSGDLYANPPSTGTTFQNDLGYSVFAPHQGTQAITLYSRPANATSNTLQLAAAANTNVLGSQNLATATNTTSTYSASLTLDRTASGYNFTVNYAGTAFSGSTATVTTSTFDSLSIFGIEGPNAYLTLDNVTVAKGPSPGNSAVPSWRSSLGLPQDGSEDLSNSSGDGVANLLKFALNLASSPEGLLVPNSKPLANPEGMTVAELAGLPVLNLNPESRAVFTYIRRRNAEAEGLAYAVMWSDGLASWLPNAAATEATLPIDDEWERVTLTDSFTRAEKPTRFARLSVTAD